MNLDYPSEAQFAGLVEAATAAADAHQRDLGKRKRGEENAYITVSNDVGSHESTRTPTLTSSAAVLFREPSEKSKKYSRPPLGKVFTSLQLAPEAFLRLQHAAKAYMLNDEFPERKDVVGHKKLSNNNDVAKLKLYECVEDFLQHDDIGEQFFGHSSSEATADALPRTFFWPEDRNKIVKLLMPLLRKMVTNERQRIYAAETRKQEPRKGDTQKSKAADVKSESMMLDTQMDPEIDPSLQADIVNSILPATTASDPPNTSNVALRVSVIRTEDGVQKRVAPEINMPSSSAPTIEEFYEQLRQHYAELPQTMKLKTWQADGMLAIHDDSEWISSQFAVGMHEWMDGQLKVLVEI